MQGEEETALLYHMNENAFTPSHSNRRDPQTPSYKKEGI